MPLIPGTRFGLFEVLAPLGAGGMARCIAPAIRSCSAMFAL